MAHSLACKSRIAEMLFLLVPTFRVRQVEATHVARAGDPLDADILANFEVGHIVIHSDNIACTLMSADEARSWR